MDAISGYVRVMWITFKTVDVCSGDLVPSCPLKTGTTATYILPMPISNEYPPVSPNSVIRNLFSMSYH